ncbi:hypothetical protein D9756_008817 [Leucocoprinus leucothites]|uniref:Major facilitator superfamily (MFS) profile domain-containing protein n=1 Tax=Leucocoprinus leucothites TaxID=201217 RepID=A0A8H5CX76_9AGAR|nr:hypothetical protein D9756_008817 [Leucoagaricus leucothites]
MFWRFFQSAGAAPGMALGASVIGDIYKSEERGTALGVFFGATLLGPALAPFVGGFTMHYFSWRVVQFGLAVFSLIGFIFMLFAFTETSHPGTLKADSLELNSRPLWRPVLVNPLAPLGLLRSPPLLVLTMVGLVTLLTDYVLLVPLAYTIGIRYNIRNEALLGACYLPSGLGNIVGAPVAGGLSDRVMKRWRLKRGLLLPEDRLRACLIGASVLVPLSILLSGLSMRYVPGPIGLVLNLVCLFMNGFGVDMVLSPSAAYIVDILQTRSAEAMAANNGLRALLLSLAVAGILPMINTYGVVVTNLISASLAWVGFAFILSEAQAYPYLKKILGVDKVLKKGSLGETKPFTNFSVFHDNLITRLKALSQIQLDFDKKCKEAEAKYVDKLNEIRKQLDVRWKQIDKFESSVKS